MSGRTSILIVAVAASLLLLLTVPMGGRMASADNGPHMKGAGATADGCAGCHRAHSGRAPSILKETQPGLCYSCHGTGGIGADTDVQDGVLRSIGEALKGGGFEFAMIDTDDPSGGIGITAAEAVTSSHTIDGTAGTMWGNGEIGSGAGPSYNLRCGACHDPHGNGNYRILRPIPPGSGGSGQNIPDESPKEYTTSNYFDVTYLGSEISSWCAQCHTRYLAGPNGAQTSSGDDIFAFGHRSDGSITLTCLKCHAAHGSNATMGTFSGAVERPDGTAGAGASDSRLLKMNNRGICQKCHNK